jgi:hypothetical protein
MLDFHKVLVFFGDDSYTVPVIAANPFGIWRNQFYWFLSHLREGSGCAFCSLILQTLNLSHEVENLESGFITARREALYSKEKETSRPNLYFLTLAIPEGDDLKPPEGKGYALAVKENHKMNVSNSMEATLRYFQSHFPPGMVPFSTTDEQIKPSGTKTI